MVPARRYPGLKGATSLPADFGRIFPELPPFAAADDTVRAAVLEVGQQAKVRKRLDLTLFLYEDGSLRIYTSQVGSAHDDARAVEPVVRCGNVFEATSALGEVLRLVAAD